VRSRWKWQLDDLLTLEDMIGQGRSDAEIGRIFGCTPNAVNIARKRHKIAPRRKAILVARRIAVRLGLGCSKTITWWITAGYLKGRRGQGCGLNRMWYVTEEALLDFLEDARYWHLWEVERLEPQLRLWASEMRDGVRFLTTGQVAAKFYVEHATVNNWIHKGYLPAVRRGNWLIRSSDLVGFVPPCERPRRARL